MGRKDDIGALLKSIDCRYDEIENAYNQALQEKEIPSDLKLKIKNFFDDARSILDYLAHDIAEKLNIAPCKIYFPIVRKNGDITSFNGFVGRHLTGLEGLNKALFDYIESIQPYKQGMSWLADFSEISNNNKHQRLTPQKRTESVRIKSTHAGGGSVAWDPSSVRFGSGVFINGAPVDPATQMPVPTANTTVTKEIWVSFLFDESINALGLIKKIRDEFPKIVSKTYGILEP